MRSDTYQWGDAGESYHYAPNPKARWWKWWVPKVVRVYDPSDYDCRPLFDWASDYDRWFRNRKR